MYRLVLILVMVVAASAANATIDSKSRSSADKPALDVAASFSEQVAVIEKNLADGETYSEITQKDRETVRAALQRISNALANAGSVENLSDAEKAKVFNDQETANNILTQAGEDSRVICNREKKVGSHRTTTQCMTVGARRRAADESQKAMRDNQRVMCGNNGCQFSRPGG